MILPDAMQRGGGAGTRKGFTLVELMAAMSVTSLIVVVMVSVSGVALDTWSRSRSEVRASQQAKAMTEAMSRDLDALVMRDGNAFQWLFAEAKVPDEGPNGASLSPNAARLIFFSAAMDRYDGKPGVPGARKEGNISTIAYELQYRDPTVGGRDGDLASFVLNRKIVNPDDTFKDLLGRTDLPEAFQGHAGRMGDLQNFVCENVYQFTVTFHVDVVDRAKKKRTLQIPVQVGRSGGPASVPEFGVFGNRLEAGISSRGDVSAEAFAAGTLSGVSISMTILTDFGIEQMRRRGFLSVDERISFVQKNSYQYSKFIAVSRG
ncbi:prepilin-type N-terminal cleavage/methylation domain-containing protein [Luteolibacter sp. SL250]|uniref:PulJ/GspJ family protein n=1 Tax=Luteolibacter sp. SL250 TaxID=2995170 RepID=UPI00226D843C|nr:prepilin-type N-terminal cleavage/methylation domain-containing protein [Luteolibacter sp. SL250]WAC19693.1 prepilin-type N-terminal cleavage/methylation domain-containing protein [Luteolibacter sp. SL250]